ncbi:MAG: hypothetical protein A3I44_05200 [Candidatus Sungbacteria bacterium RIFCSPLOWO2_02_FULL_51_17]|uniref:Uncharacterized protein n=1 Tax=Candidatus Sungbacteria bacterium RIFCSPHIGHO2_02_FULL_51_29 TaxID=1802273 RepID=A0A1G2KPI6_9BACT|nr:MAG: hypothetical protein A2676_00635 [Candidatus Sungbacteria bacterium RIFCSPHIGHO2_01_FULL_51_22]OHA01164.1 MAG: hypothetical protein A3C16_04570 [Candidatus Sungbacteria bacterium RIFCSPHIGHO2_02_FULL_51_29]OHA08052.1 MAG: hypothetical protein A3B29_03840 [Candidatus Sungbacteria bacterium RIFCSPLOWO2_01_FULL_51_34]OHA11468.1 MAG: hypothetical protein A3I44_05200 [Candidatus Sungbacteria bacterium RIFCSPLOWO2_02_FULL_51_17]
MDNSIIFHIIRRADERDLGLVSVDRTLHVDVSGVEEAERRGVSVRLHEILSGGVNVVAHGHDGDDDSRSWVTVAVPSASPDFFPAVIDMIDSGEYRVVFPKTEKRAQLIAGISTLLSGSILEEGYRRMITEKIPRLLERELEALHKTLEEERDALGRIKGDIKK